MLNDSQEKTSGLSEVGAAEEKHEKEDVEANVRSPQWGVEQTTVEMTKEVSARLRRTLSEGNMKHWWAALIRRDGGCCTVRPTQNGAALGDFNDEDEDEDEVEGDREDNSLLSSKGLTISLRKDNSQVISAALGTIAVLSYFGLGVVAYMGIESWDFIISLYFVVQTISTVGYGDVFPSTSAGKIFTIFYAFIGIVIFFRIIIWILSHLLDHHEDVIVDAMTNNEHFSTGEVYKQQLVKKASKWRRTVALSLFTMSLYFVFGAIYWIVRHRLDTEDAFLGVTHTLLTIGYHSPYTQGEITKGMMVFSIIFILSGVSLFTYLIARVIEVHIEYQLTERRGKVLRESLTTGRLKKLLQDDKFKHIAAGSSSNLHQKTVPLSASRNALGMSWGAFLSIMLLEMDVIEHGFVLEIRERYDELVRAEERKRESKVQGRQETIVETSVEVKGA